MAKPIKLTESVDAAIDFINSRKVDVVLVECDCFCTIHKGLFEELSLIFPEIIETDLATKKGDRHKLGTYSITRIDRHDMILTIVNVYSQYAHNIYDDSIDAPTINYSKLKDVFHSINTEFPNAKIAMSKFGQYDKLSKWDIVTEYALDVFKSNYITVFPNSN